MSFKLFSLSKEILNKMPDQWNAWQDLITSSLKLDSEDKVSEVSKLIESMQVNHAEMRGPLLAEMEFLSERGNIEDLPNLIVEYFKKFSTKLVTYSDIIKYIDVLSEDQRRDVYGRISAWAEDKMVTSQAEICRDVIICQLARYCGLHVELTQDQMLTQVEKLGECSQDQKTIPIFDTFYFSHKISGCAASGQGHGEHRPEAK